MSKITELRGQLDAKRKELAQIFEEAGEDYDFDKVKSVEGDSAAKAEHVRNLNDEMSDLKSQVDELEGLASMKSAVDNLGEVERHPGHPNAEQGGKQEREEQTEQKSLGATFVEDENVRSWRKGRPGQGVSVEDPSILGFGGTKATFTTTGSNLRPLSIQDQPGIVLLGQQRLTIADLLASGQTTSETVRYVVESTFTNAATTVAEGALKPEATWATDKRSDDVTKIAVLSRVTDELFSDFPMLRDYIDNRLRFMVGLTEEAQLLSGDGVGSNVLGILNRAGIQTQAKGADPTPDAFYKAITKVRTGPFVEPDGIVIHPNDWTDIRLLRTADGIYIWGAPMDSGPERLWGLPVVVTTAIAQNTGLVGAFRLGGQVWRRQGVTVDATNSNEDDFKKNLVMLRAEERLALAVYLPSAFCTVTGI